MSQRLDTRTCDKPGCDAAAAFECDCARCDRERTWVDRYHACGAHEDAVGRLHATTFGRVARWRPIARNGDGGRI